MPNQVQFGFMVRSFGDGWGQSHHRKPLDRATSTQEVSHG